MSTFEDGYVAPHNALDAAESWYDKLSVKYPNLAKALLGTEGFVNGGPTRPPLSFILSVKDGRLRFVLSNQEASRTYYGVISDVSEPLESAEACLKNDQGEWSTKKPQSTGRRY